MSDITERLKNVRSVVERYPGVVTVAVTKFQPVEKIQTALAEGLFDLGINHVQQGEELTKLCPQARLHFIGHVQGRKAKEVMNYHLVQSLDRLKIVEEWGKRLGDRKDPIDVLIEVNIGEEQQKSGVLPHEFDSFFSSLVVFSFVRVRGLMAMPPFLEPPTRRAPHFKAMRELFDAYRDSHFNILSMGTSADFEVALAEGSTMVRLGTTLFGERPVSAHG